MNDSITFNDLPQVIAQLRDEVLGMKAMLLSLQEQANQQPRDYSRITMTPEQVAEYTHIPLATIYQKIASGDLLASKPGKRYVIFRDDVYKWLEGCRKNPISQSDEENNAEIFVGHHSKPNKRSL